jgi:hypothetical protein
MRVVLPQVKLFIGVVVVVSLLSSGVRDSCSPSPSSGGTAGGMHGHGVMIVEGMKMPQSTQTSGISMKSAPAYDNIVPMVDSSRLSQILRCAGPERLQAETLAPVATSAQQSISTILINTARDGSDAQWNIVQMDKEDGMESNSYEQQSYEYQLYCSSGNCTRSVELTAALIEFINVQSNSTMLSACSSLAVDESSYVNMVSISMLAEERTGSDVGVWIQLASIRSQLNATLVCDSTNPRSATFNVQLGMEFTSV